MMKKVEISGGVSTWESLHRDILAKIFNKLDIMDITVRASRVCKSWFLASHNKTLWKTIDLTTIKPIIFQNHPVDFDSCALCRQSVINVLTEVTKLSRMEQKSLSFRLSSYILEEDLIFVSERIPTMEKLVLLLDWYNKPVKAPWFAFSLWKNLKTLIFVPENATFFQRFEFRTMGEICTNLINFKFVGCLWDSMAREIVYYLPSLKRLSFKGSYVSPIGVTLLIRGLKNLKILNLTHCTDVYSYLHYPIAKFRDCFVQAEKIIICSQDCRICRDQSLDPWLYSFKNWRNDDIKEFEC